MNVEHETSVPSGHEELQRKLVERIWDGLLVFALLSTPISLMQVTATGWKPVYFVQFFLAVLIVLASTVRQLMTNREKIVVILVAMYTLTLIGFYNFGLTSSPAVGLTCSYILTSVLLKRETALFLIVLLTAALCLIGMGYVSGSLEFAFDATTYMRSPGAWCFLILGAVLYTLLISRAFAVFRQSNLELVQQTVEQLAVIHHQATHDALTGLATLRLAKDRLAHDIELAKRSAGKVAVFYIDLDGFKAANDTYGHDAGDMVLKTVAERIKNVLRESDTAARLGGDEFLIIVNGARDDSAISSIAEKILDKVRQPIMYKDNQITIGACVGVAIFPDHSEIPEEIVNKADQAMYVVKKHGKGHYRIFSDGDAPGPSNSI